MNRIAYRIELERHTTYLARLARVSAILGNTGTSMPMLLKAMRVYKIIMARGLHNTSNVTYMDMAA